MILSGVKIRDGAVIGAGAVVTSNVEPYCIAVGNPCKQIKKRFDDDIIAELPRLKWWDWDLEQIRRHVPDLLNEDIIGFIEKAQESLHEL